MEVSSDAVAQSARLKQEFGETPSLEKWKLFRTAYQNVVVLNSKLKDVSTEPKRRADDKEYRARMILQQLNGEPLIWLSQAENQQLLKDDDDVLAALENGYSHTKARVAYINDFEEAEQRQGEDTRSFLSRLQQTATVAFPKMEDGSRRERVLSKFVRSVASTRLWEEIQLNGFPENDGTAKSYEDVLSKATRLESCWKAADNSTDVAHTRSLSTGSTLDDMRCKMRELSEQVAALRGHPGQQKQRTTYSQTSAKWQCWYCGRSSHDGGWCQCPSRRQEAPNWKPRRRPTQTPAVAAGRLCF